MRKLTSLALCAACGLLPAEAANIYWVSIHPADNTPSAAAITAGFTQAPDIGYTDLLKNAGHTVTRVLSSDLPNAALLNTADLVIISRSVPSGHYELDAETAAWNGITAPTMILGGYVLRNNRLGYTSGGTIPDTTGTVGLKVQVPGHPIFAGIELDASGRMVNPYANIATYTNTIQRGISVNTSPIAVGGVTLATIGTVGDGAFGGMVIGEWMAGDAMATSPVDTLGGHRLVLLTGSRENAAISGGAPALTADAAGIYDLTADGATILLNAVNYMTSSRASILTVTTTDNDAPPAGETSLVQALSNVQPGDTVRFKIPGAGPHVITTPLGGYPLVSTYSVNIDGYTQPGSVRNTNPILSNNNAQIKIILDSTGEDSAPNPINAAIPLRRSTRLDFPNDVGNTGYGTTENCILGFYQADSISVRGLSFLARRTPGTEIDPSIYAVALIREATNARVQGCWFGVAPGAASTLAEVKPPASAVAAFRWRIDGDVFSQGAIVGTDGDGSLDRGEFNVIVGGRIAIAVELPNLRVAGNFINLFPSGNSFLDLDANHQIWRDVFDAAGEDPDDVTHENFENGRIADNTIIGTNGDGVSDSDERNVFNQVIYDVAGEVYSGGTNLVVAGNYFGVGVDGVTKAALSTNSQHSLLALPDRCSIRIGSNGDGISDTIEGNLIANTPGAHLTEAVGTVPIIVRGNTMMNNQFPAVPFADGENGRNYTTYYSQYVNDASSGIPPVIQKFTNNIVSGSFAAANGNYPSTVIDIYLLDSAALANERYWPAAMIHPSRLVATFRDNGVGDLDPEAGKFTYDLTALAPTATTYVAATVSYSQDSNRIENDRGVTSPMSNPISPQPTINMRFPNPETVELWWLGAPNEYYLQINGLLELPDNWFEIFGETYTGGRNTIALPFDSSATAQFFRLRVD